MILSLQTPFKLGELGSEVGVKIEIPFEIMAIVLACETESVSDSSVGATWLRRGC